VSAWCGGAGGGVARGVGAGRVRAHRRAQRDRVADGRVPFIGFLPHKSGQRRNHTGGVKLFAGTLALLRIALSHRETAGELNEFFPERQVVSRGS